MVGYTVAERRTVLMASCLAAFVNPLTGSMLNLALNAISEDLGCSAHDLGWIASTFFIASVVTMVPAARVADIYGKRTVFLTGMAISIFGILMSMTAQDIHMLYLFRGVTGVGTACVASTSVSMIVDVYPRDQRGAAMAWNVACVYVGASLGPSLGGLITDLFGWRAIFLAVAPLLLFGGLMMLRFHHNVSDTAGEPFDVRGSVIYCLSISLVIFGIMFLPNVFGMVSIALGTVALIFFVLVERRTKFPVLHLSLFRNSRFTRSLTALFLNYAASYGISFYLSLYLQNIGEMTATEAGMFMMVQPVVQVFFTLVAGRLVDRMDQRVLPTLGMVVVMFGLFLLYSSIGFTYDVTMLYTAMFVMGAGFGIFSSPNTTVTMTYVDRWDYNKASALIATMRQFGMTVSMGLATCLISLFLGTDAIIEPSNYVQFVDMLRLGLFIGIVFCAIGALFSWFRGKADVSGS